MQDPIANMLTIIRNGLSSNKKYVLIPSSKQKEAIAKLFLKEGYIESFDTMSSNTNAKITLKIELKYYEKKPVIEILKRVSRPGLRIYKVASQLPKVFDGYGTAVVSTSKGVMSDKDARSNGIGGEILCYVA